MNAKGSSALIGAMIVALSVPALYAAPPVANSAAPEAAAPANVSSTELKPLQARMMVLQDQMTRIRGTTDPTEREKLLREHTQTMLEQTLAMRAFAGGLMSGTMGDGMMGRRMMGRGAAHGSQSSTPGEHGQMMQERLEMMQTLMAQMMGQIQAMESRGMGHSAG